MGWFEVDSRLRRAAVAAGGGAGQEHGQAGAKWCMLGDTCRDVA